MTEIQVSLTDLRQNLASLINRASYGGERIVLMSHGEPKAVIVGIEELRRLERSGVEVDNHAERFRRVLDAAERLRAETRQWQVANGVVAEDVVETLARLREERDNELSGLR